MAKAKKVSGTQETSVTQISIPRLQTSAFDLILYGDSPIIVNAWTQKAKLEMLKKHMAIPTIREVKDPQEQFLNSIYRFEDGEYGFPVVGVKEAMATATTDLEGIFKTQIYRNIFVKGREGFQVGAFCDILTPMELGELFSPNPPTIREDVVRLAGMQRTPDLHYRAQFWPWALKLRVSYIDRFIRSDDILNLVEKAGMQIGLAEWRQEKGGVSGSFHVATAEEQKQVAKWIKAGHQEPQPIDVEAWRASVQAREMEKMRSSEEIKAGIKAARDAEKALKAAKAKRKGNGAAADDAGSIQ